jgi:uncharacterized protein YraI
MHAKVILSAAAVITAASIAAHSAGFAASSATALSDLNVRAGPGPEHAVIGVIRANDRAIIEACIEGSQWCQITYNGRQGWAYSEYLLADTSSRPAIIADQRAPAIVAEPRSTIVYREQPASVYRERPSTVYRERPATVGVASRAIVEETPRTVANVEGTVVPPESVLTYVVDNPLDPAYIDDDVVVGDILPETVELESVPGHEYSYAYVNRQPVLVEPETRRIVYVYQ